MITEEQEEQEELVTKCVNKFIKLINDEINYEKIENREKLQKRIMNKKTDEKETIHHLTCEFKNPYENPMLIKFKSNEIIDTEINEQDRVLITDENYPFMPQEGIVVQKKQKK